MVKFHFLVLLAMGAVFVDASSAPKSQRSVAKSHKAAPAVTQPITNCVKKGDFAVSNGCACVVDRT